MAFKLYKDERNIILDNLSNDISKYKFEEIKKSERLMRKYVKTYFLERNIPYSLEEFIFCFGCEVSSTVKEPAYLCVLTTTELVIYAQKNTNIHFRISFDNIKGVDRHLLTVTLTKIDGTQVTLNTNQFHEEMVSCINSIRKIKGNRIASELSFKVGEKAFYNKQYEEAFKYYNTAYPNSNRGNIAFKLGVMYRDGLGVEPDLTKSREYFEIAYKNHISEAGIVLFSIYFEGKGVKPDLLKAVKYLEEYVTTDPKAYPILIGLYLRFGATLSDLNKLFTTIDNYLYPADGNPVSTIDELFERIKNLDCTALKNYLAYLKAMGRITEKKQEILLRILYPEMPYNEFTNTIHSEMAMYFYRGKEDDRYVFVSADGSRGAKINQFLMLCQPTDEEIGQCFYICTNGNKLIYFGIDYDKVPR